MLRPHRSPKDRTYPDLSQQHRWWFRWPSHGCKCCTSKDNWSCGRCSTQPPLPWKFPRWHVWLPSLLWLRRLSSHDKTTGQTHQDDDRSGPVKTGAWFTTQVIFRWIPAIPQDCSRWGSKVVRSFCKTNTNARPWQMRHRVIVCKPISMNPYWQLGEGKWKVKQVK